MSTLDQPVTLRRADTSRCKTASSLLSSLDSQILRIQEDARAESARTVAYNAHRDAAYQQAAIHAAAEKRKTALGEWAQLNSKLNQTNPGEGGVPGPSTRSSARKRPEDEAQYRGTARAGIDDVAEEEEGDRVRQAGNALEGAIASGIGSTSGAGPSGYASYYVSLPLLIVIAA
jgi:hypothetical protein